MSTVAPNVRAFPVSVKGVLVRGGRVLLLKNERHEWELPGGKLELGEEPQACVAREITEETGLSVTTGPILDAWQYHIGEGQDVLHQRRPERHARRAVEPDGDEYPGRCQPVGGARRPVSRLHRRPHAGFTTHHRPDTSCGMVPLPSRQRP
jgi:8-oxo-dGTP pyrophosphatase MutT (NUDIX family)